MVPLSVVKWILVKWFTSTAHYLQWLQSPVPTAQIRPSLENLSNRLTRRLELRKQRKWKKEGNRRLDQLYRSSHIRLCVHIPNSKAKVANKLLFRYFYSTHSQNLLYGPFHWLLPDLPAPVHELLPHLLPAQVQRKMSMSIYTQVSAASLTF